MTAPAVDSIAPADVRERLMSWATQGPRLEELKAAKAEFFRLTGEVRAEEPTFDAWMDAFADWFLCDRPLGGGAPPAAQFLADEGGRLNAVERASVEGLTRTRWSLFVVDKHSDNTMVVKDLLDGQRRRVVARRRLVGLNRGDVFEARLQPQDGGAWLFTGMPLFHPPQVRRMVLRVAAHARKGGVAQFGEAVRQLALRRLKVDRYRKVAPKALYQDLMPRRSWLFFWR